MGTYTPIDKNQRPTLNDTLSDAEADHYLDCPSADLLTRAAAQVIDLIFCSIGWTAVFHLCVALSNSVAGGDRASPLGALIVQLAWGLRVAFVVTYLTFPVSRFGGSPGKLLLGLRVVDEATGYRLGLSRTLLREGVGKALSLASFGVGIWIALGRTDRRTFHDLLSRSVVKKVHNP